MSGTYDDLTDYAGVDSEVCENLGIILSKDKPFISRDCGIFFEEYSNISFKHKEYRIPCALSYCFLAENKLHARYLCNSIMAMVDGSNELVDDILLELSKFWGNDGLIDEVYINFVYGGWYTRKRNVLSMSLL